MLGLKCRLCSSACGLISLSGGKCRKNRDYIRKLVEFTTGIKFEKDDCYKCICYPCTIQVYNFYIFKTRSLENEEILEAHIAKDEKTKSNKIQILDLGTIVLPDSKQLQDTLVPWLISKSKYCELVNSESGEDADVEPTKHNSITDNISKTVKNVSGTNVSTQCDLPKNTWHKSTQNDLPKPSFDKYTQCTVPNIAIHTQTNGVLTKSSKIQCCLLKDDWEKQNCSNSVQPKPKGVNKATQHYDSCENCRQTDCKCYIHNLMTIKQEPLLSTSINLSPIVSLSKNNAYTSTPNNSLVKNTSQNGITCKMCDKTFPSKESYASHKKSHLVCSFCRKKFPSMKRTKWHIDSDCETKKRVDIPTVVRLIRMENLNDIRKNYSKCLEDLKHVGKNKVRSTMRMRSRSTSSTDSLYSCCSFCRNSLTVLHDLKWGTDKAVQTNLFDSHIVSGDIMLKSKIKNIQELMSPAKKIKLSDSLVG